MRNQRARIGCALRVVKLTVIILNFAGLVVPFLSDKR